VYIATGYAHDGSLTSGSQFTAFLFGYPDIRKHSPEEHRRQETGARHVFGPAVLVGLTHR